jgi:hypothetical protein
MRAHLLALAIVQLRVKLYAQVRQESNRSVADLDDFVADSMSDYCHRCDKSLTGIILLLGENFIFKDIKSILPERPRFREDLAHCSLSEHLHEWLCNATLVVTDRLAIFGFFRVVLTTGVLRWLLAP